MLDRLLALHSVGDPAHLDEDEGQENEEKKFPLSNKIEIFHMKWSSSSSYNIVFGY